MVDHGLRRDLDADRMLASYLDRTGGLQAYQQDPESRLQVDMLRDILRRADAAMEDEGVGAETRERVIRALVYGSPDPYLAERRIRAREAEIKLIERHNVIDWGPIAASLADRGFGPLPAGQGLEAPATVRVTVESPPPPGEPIIVEHGLGSPAVVVQAYDANGDLRGSWEPLDRDRVRGWGWEGVPFPVRVVVMV